MDRQWGDADGSLPRKGARLCLLSETPLYAHSRKEATACLGRAERVDSNQHCAWKEEKLEEHLGSPTSQWAPEGLQSPCAL